MINNDEEYTITGYFITISGGRYVNIVITGVTKVGSDFEYTYEGQTLTYTILSSTDKTVETKAGDRSSVTAGNNVAGNLIIPSVVNYNGDEYTVTAIGESSFFLCKDLTSVNIPNTVSIIKDGAFEECYNLISVIIPNSVVSIDDYAFCGCSSMSSINIPESVISIGYYAFMFCDSLDSITIPKSVASIGDMAFISCDGLTEVTYLSDNPCTADFNIFTETVYQNATLNIPLGSIAKYRSITPWNNFKNIKEIDPSGEHDPSEFPVADEVDLGLSVNWASWNMGASEVLDYGGKYGWGDPTGKNISGNLDDYPCPFPPENISGTEYDIATKQWGNGWRIPTWDEFTELAKNSTVSVGIAYGIEYLKVTSKINGNHIILPCDIYWSSTLNDVYTTNAEAATANKNGSIGRLVDGFNRSYRGAIRPVRDRRYSPVTSVIEGHESVDLGLPSGIKWATCNVGAYSATDNGCYYSWGEVEEKYPHNPTNTRTYGKIMANISGNASYDAAAHYWGGNWRMPTKEDVQELIDNCSFTPFTVDGKTGTLVTGPNGNQIFLPVTGEWRNPDFAADKFGYWTGSSVDNDKYSSYVLWRSIDSSTGKLGEYSRVFGCPIRAVNNGVVEKEPGTYNIGDAYPDASNPQGIVTEIDNTGKHGKVISRSYSDPISWGPLTDASSVNQYNGAQNQLPSGDLKRWVSSLGNDWYIPALTELTVIAHSLSTINDNLARHGMNRLPDGLYWSSTQYSH